MGKITDMFLGAAFFVLIVIASLAFVGAIYRDGELNAFVDACKTMDGVPLVGTHGTKACLKAETLK